MKKSIVTSLMLISISAFAADNASVNGKWNVHINVSGNESDSVCTFTQKDAELTGECTTEYGAKALKGKVDGQKVSWSYTTEYNGSPLNLAYSGTLDSSAGKLSGTVNVVEYNVDGDFTAAPTK
jgi:hypothetical protein